MLCFILAAVVSLISFFFFRRSSQFRRLRLPPGSLGLPYIGETLQLISAYKTENPEPFIDDRVRRFGSVFTTHVFGEPTVFSADAETNRFILQNEGKFFCSSYPSSISNLLGRHSLLLMKGDLHKRMHSLTTSFANSSIIRDHLLVDIDRLIGLNMDCWSSRILLMEETKKITFELAVKQLLSFDPGEWTESLRKEYVLVIEGFFTLPLPFSSTTYGRAIAARRKVADELKLIVRERRRERAGGERKKDMLGALLGGDDDGGFGFSEDEIVDFLFALLVAGYETTSTIMTLAVKFLTETPLALEQLKKMAAKRDKMMMFFATWTSPTHLLLLDVSLEEHRNIKAKKSRDEGLLWSDYKSMFFTKSVISETLRFANIISGVFRRATRDVHIKGHTIPKGWKVFASFRAVHLDHDHFKDARSFDPWRWQNLTGETSSANVFTPFGGGPRLCPGSALARVQISIFLHHFVTRFSWVPAEEDKLLFFPTTRTRERYPINLQLCNESEL